MQTTTDSFDGIDDIYEGNLTAEMLGVSEAESYTDAIAKGETAQRRGELDKAAAYFVRAIELASEAKNQEQISFDDVAEAGVRLAKLYQSRGMHDQAERVYLMVLQMDETQVAALEAMGIIRLRERRINEASDYLLASVKHWWELQKADSSDVRFPAPVQALNGLGIIADLAENYDQAIGYYQKALTLTPVDYKLMNNLGYSSYLNGQWQEAERWYGKALNLAPDYPLALKNYALLKTRQKKYDEAILILEQFMAPWEASHDVAYMAMLANDLVMAEAMFIRAIELSPSFYAEAWEQLERIRQI